MTTKETLHELIDNLSDEEAAELLAHVRRDAEREGAKVGEELSKAERMARAPWAFTVEELAGSEKPKGGKSLLEIFEEAWRNIRPEDLENWPSSDNVDEVVYRLHGD